MGRLFGTDGVRGLANTEPLTPATIFRLGRAAGYVFQRHETRTVVIGKDSRISGDMLESALVAGLCSVGTNVCRVGVVPTPALAHLTGVLSAQAGIMISASHNPMPDNGIKIFAEDGTKLPDAVEDEIERVMFEDNHQRPDPTGAGLGHVAERMNAVDRYLQHVRQSVQDLDLAGLTIVVDCANGACSQVTPRMLEELGAEVITIHAVPDGLNINANCGSQHPEAVQGAVMRHLADLGMAHDGDGDRVVLVDEMGQILNGDHILAICGIQMALEQRLPGRRVVGTVLSNYGLELALKRHDVELVRSKVGDRYVWETMVREGAMLGGEQAGHVIFREFSTTGDGLITALQVLRIMLKRGEPLSKLADCIELVPQVAVDVPVSSKPDLSGFPRIQQAIADAEAALGDQGRVIVRYSGTEPLARVNIEGPDEAIIRAHAENIAEAIRQELAAPTVGGD